MKKVWITALSHDEEASSKLVSAVGQYGLAVEGHFWTDDLKNMAWASARDPLLAKETVVWLILGPAESFSSESVRYGLSMLSLAVQARRGHQFPVLFVSTSGEVAAAALPTPLRSLQNLSLASPALGAKIIAQANLPAAPVEKEYLLDVHSVPGIGQWFEVGPAPGRSWTGALFGIDDGEIDSHAVGPQGYLPERAVLQYPQKGLKLQLGEREYTAWAVKNPVDDRSAYFLRVKGYPAAVVFGAFPEGDDAEMFSVSLK